MDKKVSGEPVVKDIRRRTRKKYSSEEKIRIVIDGLSRQPKVDHFWIQKTPTNIPHH